MTYNQFIEAVEARVKESVKDNVAVYVYTAMKNSGRERTGITISKQGINILPTIYLEEYYQQFQQGNTLKGIVGEILKLYENVLFQHSWDEKFIQSYAKISDSIVYRLINRERNKALLAQIPYVPYLDLAIAFCVLIKVDKYGTATMPIRNEHLKLWEVTKDEIYQKACDNTERILPYDFKSVKAVIEELKGTQSEIEEGNMYVLSNKIGNFGAAAILYKNRLKSIGHYLKDNFYVLPSSIQEVIVVPERKALSKGNLSIIVKEINESLVEKEELLSDCVYYYDRESDKMVCQPKA